MGNPASAVSTVLCMLLVTCSVSRPETLNRSNHTQLISDDLQLIHELTTDNAAGNTFLIEVLSSPGTCRVQVDGRVVFYRTKGPPPKHGYPPYSPANGMYAVSLSAVTGRPTGDAFATGHVPNAAYVAMEEFVGHVQRGRLLVLCVLSEAAMSLDSPAQAMFRRLNSSFAPDVQVRSMFGMVAVKDGPVLAEGYSLNLDAAFGTFGGVLRLATRAPRATSSTVAGCLSGPRANFCADFDGYADVCDCAVAEWPPQQPPPRGALFPYPVIVVASDRPRYLARCLTSLLANRGLDPVRLVVFVDGDYPEVRRLAKLMNVQLHQHIYDSGIVKPNDIGSHIGSSYRYTMETAFEMFSDADKIVLLEEDLQVSPDFISYFNQTYHLLDIDVSLYCVSAWNDHGYNHTVGDPAQLYRVGFMPGLGWMLKRHIFFEEILPAWPHSWTDFDWDVLIRLPKFRKSRDCIVPDVSRTYHFGFVGKHVGAMMQYKYFVDHALNTLPDVQLKNLDKMIYHRYEELLMQEITNAISIDGTIYDNTSRSCDIILPSGPTNHSYILFIRMNDSSDMAVWEKVATCLNLWDLDTRGDHRGLWRFWYHGNPVMVIGVPHGELSDFAIHAKGNVIIFGGERTAKQKKLGRWPPGLPRRLREHGSDRIRLALAAAKRAQDE